MGPLFDAIIANIDPPHVESQEPEKLQVRFEGRSELSYVFEDGICNTKVSSLNTATPNCK